MCTPTCIVHPLCVFKHILASFLFSLPWEPFKSEKSCYKLCDIVNNFFEFRQNSCCKQLPVVFLFVFVISQLQCSSLTLTVSAISETLASMQHGHGYWIPHNINSSHYCSNERVKMFLARVCSVCVNEKVTEISFVTIFCIALLVIWKSPNLMLHAIWKFTNYSFIILTLTNLKINLDCKGFAFIKIMHSPFLSRNLFLNSVMIRENYT